MLEYCIVTEANDEEATRTLNELVKAGWYLVQVLMCRDNAAIDITLVMSREV